MNPMQSVSAVQYEIKVYEGMNDFAHGGGHMVKEIFVQSHQVIMDSEGHLFHAKKPRNIQSGELFGPEVNMPLKDIQLPLELVEKVAHVAKMKLEISQKEKELKSQFQELFT